MRNGVFQEEAQLDAHSLSLAAKLILCSLVWMEKNQPAMEETWVWSLGWEDPLEKGMATHSSIFAWRIPWIEEPSGYNP